MSLSTPVLRRALRALERRHITTLAEFMPLFCRGSKRGQEGRSKAYLARLKKKGLVGFVEQVMIDSKPELVGYTLLVHGRERLEQLRDAATVQREMFA
jgi:DNA-binding PadR family transcriptional regulator